MLEYFIRCRRGTITVMLSIILIAALSLNSTLIEMAKYHSMKRLYKEMEENAAFSLLSYYDRDLYENFGFLALEQGVGKEELTRYLQMNLAGLDSGLQLNRADILANVTNADVEGLYPLSQKDVYVSQMMEFSAYRAPASLVNNALNIEETLEMLMEKLEEALPILNMFQQLTEIVEKYVTMVICLYEYYEAALELQIAAESYNEKLGSYNASISEIDNLKALISSYESMEEEEEDGQLDLSAHEAKLAYEEQLIEMQQIAEENAVELKKCIAELDPVLVDYGEKMQAYIDAYDEALGATATQLLEATKQELDGIGDKSVAASAKNFIDKIQTNINDGQGVFDTMQSYIKNIPAQQIEDARTHLEEQIEKLSVPAEDLMQLEAVKEVDPAGSAMLVFLVQWVSLIDTIGKMVEGLAEAIEMIAKGVKAMNLAFSGSPCDWDMNHTISNAVVLTSAVNPYEEEDMAAVQAKLNDSAEIGESVGYDPQLLAPGESWETSALENAMKNLVSAESDFREACNKLEKGSLIEMLQSLIELVGAARNFIVSIIGMINVFIGISIDDFMQIIYQKLFATVYATEMFSNRVTDMQSDTRLNGSNFFTKWDYADAGKCFVQADAEYIYCGSNNEILNQTLAFTSILMFRVLCNVTSVLTDQELMDVISGLMEAPVIGWIAALVIVLVKLILEAWFDMIQMIYAKGEVDILKLDGGYFALSGDGIDDLEEMVKAVIKEQTGVEVDTVKLSGMSGSARSGVYEDTVGNIRTSAGLVTSENSGTGSGTGTGGNTGTGSGTGTGGNTGTGSGTGTGGNTGTGSGTGTGGNTGTGSGAGTGGNTGTGSGTGTGGNTGTGSGAGTGGNTGTGSGTGTGGNAGTDGNTESGGNAESDKTSGFIDDYTSGLMKWGYKDHLFLLMLLFTPSNQIYSRSATLIETQLQQKKAKDGAPYVFKLDEMATYIRVDTEAEYQPLLPVPVIPGLNDTGIKVRTVHYSGY